jgi:hypothetical protein
MQVRSYFVHLIGKDTMMKMEFKIYYKHTLTQKNIEKIKLI